MIAHDDLRAALGVLLLVAGCAAPTSTVDDPAAFFDALKGQSVGTAFAALGQADDARPVPGGAYVLVWRRYWTELVAGRRAGQACLVQAAVTRTGRVSDVLVTGDTARCAALFNWRPVPTQNSVHDAEGQEFFR